MSNEDGPPDEGRDSPQEDAMQDMIGHQLRSLYASVLDEPIPDKIVELLAKLDEVTGHTDGDTSAPRDDRALQQPSGPSSQDGSSVGETPSSDGSSSGGPPDDGGQTRGR